MAKRIILFLVMGMLLLPCQIYALDIYFSGNLKGQMRYTPERDFETLKLLKVSAQIESDNNPFSLVAKFDGIGNDFAWQAVTDPFASFNFSLRRITLTTKGPLVYGGASALLSVGDVKINYSPLIARVDDTVKVNGIIYNPMRMGVSLENFQFGMPFLTEEMKLSSFLIWDSNNATGIGAKANFNLGSNNVEFSVVQKVNDFGSGKQIVPLNTARLLEINRQVKGGVWGLRLGESQDFVSSQVEKTGSLVGTTLQKALARGVTGKVEYLKLSPDFEPAYRDKAPRFNEEGKYIGWNMLDSLRHIEGLASCYQYNQDQLRLGFDVGEESANFNVLVDLRNLTAQNLPEAAFRGAKLTGKVKQNKYTFSGTARMQELTLIGNNIKSTDQGTMLKFDVKRDLAPATSLVYTWKYNGLYPDTLVLTNSVRLEKTFAQLWVLKGAKVFGGVELNRDLPSGKAEIPIAHVGMSYKNSSGVSFEARYATANKVENPSRIYDEDGIEYLGYDNIVSLGLNLAF